MKFVHLLTDFFLCKIQVWLSIAIVLVSAQKAEVE